MLHTARYMDIFVPILVPLFKPGTSLLYPLATKTETPCIMYCKAKVAQKMLILAAPSPSMHTTCHLCIWDVATQCLVRPPTIPPIASGFTALEHMLCLLRLNAGPSAA